MTEHLFGTNKNYFDSGDFSHRYFYQLRDVFPTVEEKRSRSIKTSKQYASPKEYSELAMDKARAKANRRYRG
ncbi:hypothetical protein HPG84_24220 (plasmid) [Salmonella enterica]|nr:hypothetical protein HPG84_24220 [Salmonella enterica]